MGGQSESPPKRRLGTGQGCQKAGFLLPSVQAEASLPRGLVLSHTHLQCGRCRFDPWVRKIPWRRTWQLTPVFLPGESHGQKSLAGYSPWDRKESDMTERLILSPSPWKNFFPGLFFFQPGTWKSQRPLSPAPLSSEQHWLVNMQPKPDGADESRAWETQQGT